MRHELSTEEKLAELNRGYLTALEPLMQDIGMLELECIAISTIADAMRDHAAKTNAGIMLQGIWQDRINRLDGQAAVGSLLLTKKREDATQLTAKYNELTADVEFEASITPGTVNDRIVH